MTHDELLAKINMPIPMGEIGKGWQLALCAVVELHQIATIYGKTIKGRNRCTECGFAYPCPTIQEIEKELG